MKSTRDQSFWETCYIFDPWPIGIWVSLFLETCEGFQSSCQGHTPLHDAIRRGDPGGGGWFGRVRRWGTDGHFLFFLGFLNESQMEKLTMSPLFLGVFPCFSYQAAPLWWWFWGSRFIFSYIFTIFSGGLRCFFAEAEKSDAAPLSATLRCCESPLEAGLRTYRFRCNRFQLSSARFMIFMRTFASFWGDLGAFSWGFSSFLWISSWQSWSLPPCGIFLKALEATTGPSSLGGTKQIPTSPTPLARRFLDVLGDFGRQQTLFVIICWSFFENICYTWHCMSIS